MGIIVAIDIRNIVILISTIETIPVTVGISTIITTKDTPYSS